MSKLAACILLVAVRADLEAAPVVRSDRAMLRAEREMDDSEETSTYTPLMVAAYAGQLSMVQKLLASGSKVDSTDASGITPLMLATFAGEEDMVRLLLAAGAAVDQRDAQGRTALMVAAYRGDAPVARRLLSAGSAVAAASREGVTAGQLAVHGGHEELVELLHAAGTQRLVEAADATRTSRSDGGVAARALVDALHAAKAVGVEDLLIGHAEKRLAAVVAQGQGDRLLAQLQDSIRVAVEDGQVGEMTRLNEAIEHTVRALQRYKPVDTPAARRAMVRKSIGDGGRTGLAVYLAAMETWSYAADGARWEGFAVAFPILFAVRWLFRQ